MAMNLRKFFMTAAGLCLFTTSVRALPQPVDQPLPLVGTAGHGHAYPGATVPFGMVQLSPDTRTEGWDGCSGYHYSDSTIQGFSHTHLSGTGAACLGDILLMPTVGEVYLNAGSPGQGYSSRFSHSREKATPGYYSVFLEDPKVTAELTATLRCGFHKYVFPESDQAHIILDLVHGIGNKPVDASLNIENNDTISGYRISNGWGGRRAIYFVIQFSKPFDSFGIERNGERLAADSREANGRNLKAFVNYKTGKDETILLKVGISGASIEGARKNLTAEIPDWNFNKVRASAVKQWKNVFDTIQVKTFDPKIRTTFYANLYLTCLAPVLFNDVDGTYRGMDQKNHAEAGFQNYTTFSIWDIYRAEWPLLTLMHPNRINDMVQSMLAEYREFNRHTTPIWPLWGNETWCMIGYHSVDMIAEAYLEGFRDFNAESAYQAMRDTAMQDRNGLKTYKELGYVASARGAAATSKTLEYTFDDWCLARMAEALGHKDDAGQFYQRAANYYNLFDRTTGFFRGRKADGTWRRPFTPIGMVGDEYTEADAWQYAFSIQQDVPGMMALYGGKTGFVQKLDTLFTTNSTIDTGIPDITGLIGQYAHGDEQCQHVAYLYDYVGEPYKTQQRVREVMSTFYNETPSGQCGNVDCGQMAAWYVFSALGLYPLNPGSGIYAIGSPVVSKAVVHLDQKKYNGGTFSVIAQNNSSNNIYIQSASLNGKSLSKPWLTREQITSGGTLRLVMGPKPNVDWGSGADVRPPATMPVGFSYPVLPEPASDKLVTLPFPIRVVCGNDEPVGNFVPDPNMIQGGSSHADTSVDTSVPHAAPEAVYQSERYGKNFTYTFPVSKDEHYLVRLHFAEIFDRGTGTRIENIEINDKLALTNFDVFAAAGGMNKAVVKEFPEVAPDDHGNITIRIASTPNSPDQNAKISGIEILKQGSVDEAALPAPLIVNTTDGKCKITIDTAAAPELTDWANHKLAPVLAEWYPKIATLLSSEGYVAPTHFKITIKPMKGVAYTTGTRVFASSTWLKGEIGREAIGSLVHETVHVIQQYKWEQYGNSSQVPAWLTEGLADYIRWFKYEPESHGADIVWMRKYKHFSPNYNDSYRFTANFLDWVSRNYDKDIAVQLNAAIRQGTYKENVWEKYTGKTVQTLGEQWKNEIKTQLASQSVSNN